MTTITLTSGQQTAMNTFIEFLADPTEQVMVLKGYSGTGKSTLVKFILEQLPTLMQTVRLLNPQFPDYIVALTATTNKAAEALSQITGHTVSTIHSYLGLRVQTDYRTFESRVIATSDAKIENEILFIDEASYIDSHLLSIIFQKVKNCKVIFMGDPAQLTPVKSNKTPVFSAGFKTAELTEVVRQGEGNPIIEVSTRFRETVRTGEFFSFRPDGHHIIHVERTRFHQLIEQEFTRRNWKYSDSKILAWTNKTVIAYNHLVRDLVKGDPEFQPGDYAVCNKYINVGRNIVKTDQMVLITSLTDATEYGVQGKYVGLDGGYRVFMPNSLKEKKQALLQARNEGKWGRVEAIENTWIDLRAAYACTVNKAQGSTYNQVFIDLDDIAKCNSGEQIARMLYVAISRAKDKVVLVGDIT